MAFICKEPSLLQAVGKVPIESVMVATVLSAMSVDTGCEIHLLKSS